MTKTLEEKIEERKQQVCDRNIMGKVQVVAEKLGEPVKYENDDVRQVGHCYVNGLLSITSLKVDAFPTHGFSGRNFVYTFVVYNCERTFESEDNEVKGYIPGKWEEKLDDFYKKVQVSQPKEEDPLREKAAKFGLKY